MKSENDNAIDGICDKDRLIIIHDLYSMVDIISNYLNTKIWHTQSY